MMRRRKIQTAVVGLMAASQLAIGASGAASAQVAGSTSPSTQVQEFGTNGVVTWNSGPGVSECSLASLGELPDGSRLLNACELVLKAGSGGSLDPTFGVGGVLRPTGRTVVVDDSGRLLTMTSTSPPGAVEVQRYTTGGDLDPSFAAGSGKLVIPTGPAPLSYPSTVRTGNSVVFGGSTSAGDVVAKFSLDGVPDVGWGTNGVVALPAGRTYNGILPRPNGDVVVMASSVRLLHPEGTLDPAFGVGGTLSVASPSRLRMLADNSLLGFDGSAVRHYTPLGQLDTSFGSGGLLTMIGDEWALASDSLVAVRRSSGSIELARYGLDGVEQTRRTLPAIDPGYSTTKVVLGQDDSMWLDEGTAIRRLDATLAVDTTFAAVSAPGHTVIRPQGGGGLSVSEVSRIRTYDATGVLRTTTTVDLSRGASDGAADAVVDAQGRMTVLVYTDPTADGLNDTLAGLVRFLPNGAVDHSFGVNGFAAIPRALESGTIQGIDEFGNYYVRAFGSGFRLRSDGSLDTTLDPDGGWRGWLLALLSGGRSLTSTADGIVMHRLDGTPDTTFAGDGTLTTAELPMAGSIGSAVVTAGNRVLMCGTAGCSRSTSSGALDATYGGDGQVTPAELWPGASSPSTRATMFDDGRVILEATAAAGRRTFLLGPDGTASELSEPYGSWLALADGGFVHSSQRADAAGATTTVVRRYRSDATLDTGFGVNGQLTIPMSATVAVAGNHLFLQTATGPVLVSATGEIQSFPTAAGHLTAGLDGSVFSVTSVSRFGEFDLSSADVQITRLDLEPAASQPQPPAQPQPPSVEPLAVPERLLDTRTDSRGGVAPAPIAAGSFLELVVAGRSGVPADAAAVAVNITAVGPQADGYLTVWPCGEPMPTASNVNYRAGENTPNLVIAKLGSGGKICIFSEQSTGVIADVAAFFAGDSPFIGMNPVRVLETRPNAQRVNFEGDKPAAGETIRIPLADSGVPADASAIVVNVTGTDPTAAGYLTVWPCGEPMPTASNLNLAAGATRANLVVSKLGAGSAVCIYTEAGAHLVADLAGYFPAASDYQAINPTRVLETRPDAGQRGYGGAKPRAGETVHLDVRAMGAIPASTSAVVLNVTATDATAGGFVTVWPCGETMPTASNLNLMAGQTAPNLVIAKPASDGTVCLYTDAGTHLIADLAGYFPSA